MLKQRVVDRFKYELGDHSRSTAKVAAWTTGLGLGAVVQTDQTIREEAAYVWLPYPPDGKSLPELALEYPGEAGLHSNTYASPGLERGKLALKLVLREERDLDEAISYIRAFQAFLPLPETRTSAVADFSEAGPVPVDVSRMPRPPDIKPRREAIPRVAQREVWQRDGGRCVECGTREKRCFDHIVLFSRGGSNSVRNLQLLCEMCNLSKGNRI